MQRCKCYYYFLKLQSKLACKQLVHTLMECDNQSLALFTKYVNKNTMRIGDAVKNDYTRRWDRTKYTFEGLAGHRNNGKLEDTMNHCICEYRDERGLFSTKEKKGRSTA